MYNYFTLWFSMWPYTFRRILLIIKEVRGTFQCHQRLMNNRWQCLGRMKKNRRSLGKKGESSLVISVNNLCMKYHCYHCVLYLSFHAYIPTKFQKNCSKCTLSFRHLVIRKFSLAQTTYTLHVYCLPTVDIRFTG